jgi:hypothetical protein
MEAGVPVTPESTLGADTFFSSAKSTEVFRGARYKVIVELENDAA